MFNFNSNNNSNIMSRTSTVKGNWPMGKSPYQVLNQFVDNLIRENAERTRDGLSLFISNVDEIDQQTLCAYLIEADRVEKWDWLVEGDNEDVLQNILSIAKTYDTNARFNLITSIEKTMIKSLQKEMQDIIDERLPWVESDMNYEDGLRPLHDSTNGEVRWI